MGQVLILSPPVSNPLATPSFGRPPGSTPPIAPQLPIKRLTPVEIQEKRAYVTVVTRNSALLTAAKNRMILLLDDECSNSPIANDSETIKASRTEIVSEKEVSLHAFTNNSNL